jgi:hypothetical protein
LSGVTRVGCGIWDWDRFVALDCRSRILYLALYTSANVKRTVPGLFHGGLGALAEAARMPAQDTVEALDDLIRRQLAEWDKHHQIIRLTELPDAEERPFNGKTILGWWNRFQSVPACGVRDAHVQVLRGLLDAGVATADHEKAWEKTFATVKVMAPRRRGVRALLPPSSEDSPQADLFASADLGNRIRYPIGYPQDQDQDQDSDLETVSASPPVPVPVPVVSAPPPAPPPPPPVQEPALAPVIALPVTRKGPLPFTIADAITALESSSRGRFVGTVFDQRLAKPITDLIRQCAEQGIGVDAFQEVGAWLGRGGMNWCRDALGPSWLAKSGAFFEALNQARAARASPARGGRADPSPPTSFRGGRRKL